LPGSGGSASVPLSACLPPAQGSLRWSRLSTGQSSVTVVAQSAAVASGHGEAPSVTWAFWSEVAHCVQVGDRRRTVRVALNASHKEAQDAGVPAMAQEISR